MFEPLTNLTMVAPMIFTDRPQSQYRPSNSRVLRRSALLIIALLAALGGAAIYMLALPAGAEHTLDTPGQRPSPDELTVTVIDFFAAALR